MSVLLDDSGTSQDEDRELAFDGQTDSQQPPNTNPEPERKGSSLAELEELFKNRYTAEEPTYAKLETEGIPPPICIFPYHSGNRDFDNNRPRGAWRGRGGRHRPFGNRPDRNDRQGGGGGGGGYGGWRNDRRNDRRDDWNSDNRRGRQRSRSPVQRGD